jgi:hypothetical protein
MITRLFAFATLVLSAAVSLTLRCHAADAGPAVNLSSSAIAGDFFKYKIKAIDGSEAFYKLFHLTNGGQIMYHVTVEHSGNPTQADALDKAWAAMGNQPGINRKAEANAITQRFRQGYQDSFTYKIYISNNTTPSLVVERVSENNWDKGFVQKIFFTGNNITEISPSSKSVSIWPLDANRYVDLVNNFPALHSAFRLVPDRLQLVTSPHGASCFTVHLPNEPFSLLYLFDSNQVLIKEQMTLFSNKNLRVAQFHYSSQWPLWPSNITCDLTAPDGKPVAHEQWHLLGVEQLPDGFNFNPEIPKAFRVLDKTNPHISNSEINRLLRQ